MMCSYCTLFDSNYLAKGLAMYYSLLKHCNSFCLYIFAFDKKTEIVLKKMGLKNVVVVSLKDLEDEDLLAVKSSRTNAEYFWTCSSAAIWYCMKNFNIDICTYVDADLFFFSDPSILLDEMGDDDVLITEHRYTSQYDFTSLTGIYCVQFMSFKNTTNGLSVLNWWRSECLKWCYDRFEDGKYGDQKYLDDWPTRFTGIHVLQHLGGGMAPWNMQQYARHGIGALEITPIYGVQGNDRNNISYLSPQWMDMLRFCEEEGKKDGIEIDMATGTGWPFGGPWVPIDEDNRDIWKHRIDICKSQGKCPTQ